MLDHENMGVEAEFKSLGGWKAEILITISFLEVKYGGLQRWWVLSENDVFGEKASTSRVPAYLVVTLRHSASEKHSEPLCGN